MAKLAAAMLVVFLVLTLFVRVAVQWRAIGKTGLIGLRKGAGPLEYLSGLLFIGGMAVAIVAIELVLQDTLDPIDALDVDALHVVGFALAAIGGTAVFLAQLGMGANWRIGVSEDQGTDLVTGGWFRICRNPIYTAMIVGWIGFALMVPTWLAYVAVVMIASGLELQVRVVEEPYLVRTHGSEYGAYAARVGRFVPGVGRLR